MVGAQKGALLLGVDIFSLNFSGLFSDLSPAFAPKNLIVVLISLKSALYDIFRDFRFDRG